MFTRIDHIGIAVPDLDAAIETYRKLGSHDLGPVVDVADQKVRAAMIACGESGIELLSPTAPDSPVAKFLEKRGPGLHHVAYRVHCIDEAMAEVVRQGMRPLTEHWHRGYGGALLCFVHPKDMGGVLVELVERPEGKPQEPPFKK